MPAQAFEQVAACGVEEVIAVELDGAERVEAGNASGSGGTAEHGDDEV